jgi:hypothetical protein
MMRALFPAPVAACWFAMRAGPRRQNCDLRVQSFSKLKHELRKAAQRSFLALWSRIALILDAFTPEACANDFRNSGYDERQLENALESRLKARIDG